MQSESPTEKRQLVPIDRITDEIRGRYLEATQLARDSVSTGKAAVVAAYECGQLLNRAKNLVGHGDWENWCSTQFQRYNLRTMRRWASLAKRTRLSDLEDCKGLTAAYVLAEKSDRDEGTGTVDVDIFACFVKHIDRLSDKLEGLDLTTLPPERKDEARARLREIEGRL